VILNSDRRFQFTPWIQSFFQPGLQQTFHNQQSGTALKKERQHESNRTAKREILKLCAPNKFGVTKISIQHCVKHMGRLDCQNRASDGDTRKAA
jgi:hypothetical protein